MHPGGTFAEDGFLLAAADAAVAAPAAHLVPPWGGPSWKHVRGLLDDAGWLAAYGPKTKAPHLLLALQRAQHAAKLVQLECAMFPPVAESVCGVSVQLLSHFGDGGGSGYGAVSSRKNSGNVSSGVSTVMLTPPAVVLCSAPVKWSCQTKGAGSCGRYTERLVAFSISCGATR